MLWLALYCPTLALDCLVRRWPAGLAPALAVTDVDGSRRFIAATTAAAQACGVYAGQSVATAMALLPDLVVVARRIDDERRALTEAALAALFFTPTVSLRTAGLVMEVSASLRLFGGWRALKQRIAAAMRIQGLVIAAAEGPTPHGAWLLAKDRARRRFEATRAAQRLAARPRPRSETAAPRSPATRMSACGPDGFDAALDAVPLVHLESLGPAIRRMAGIGCHTFADLRRLPAKGLARRFGVGLIDELARASGARPDPQTLFEAPSRFEARIELMARVESAEALVFASQRLLAQLSGWLTARRAAVRGFTLVLHHDRWTRDAIEPTAVVLALASPSSDLDRLMTLVRERLSRLELKAPVVDLSLAAPAIVAEEEAAGTLFPEREAATETLARLLEKLTARLGAEAMARIERVADHRPERAWRTVRSDVLDAMHTRGVAAGRAQTRSASSDPSRTGIDLDAVPDIGVAHRPKMPGCTCGPRPAWLLAEPQQLTVRSDRPLFESLPLYLMAGPERIEAGWWDDAPATRDYFIAENAAGRLVWIYRERLLEPDRPQWYLQGLFG
jgi:protein ImuB